MTTLLDDNTSLDYLKEDYCTPYTEEEEILMFNRYNSLPVSSPERKIIRNEIIMHNQKLLVSIAKYYKNISQTYSSLEDLINEGNIGLIKAIDKFDSSTGNKFSTYATYWIKQTICRYINQKNDFIRIPDYLKHLWIKISNFIKIYYLSHNYYPEDNEILNNIDGLTMKQLQDYYIFSYALKDIVSLNYYVDTDEGESSELQDYIMSDIYTDEEAIENVMQECFENKVNEILFNGIRKHIISERDAQIFKKRFGIGLEKYSTLQSISEEYNITKERVRQIERKVLRYFKIPKNMIKLKKSMSV